MPAALEARGAAGSTVLESGGETMSHVAASARSKAPSRVLASTFLGLWACLSSGCGATCDRNPDQPPVVYTDGITDLARGTYETSSWAGPYLDFPAGRTYELVHGLGQTPHDVVPYLSFDRCPMPEPCEQGEDEVSNVTIGAGNQVVIEAVDDTRIVLRNDTCSGIRLRVTASVAAPRAMPDAGGAP